MKPNSNGSFFNILLILNLSFNGTRPDITFTLVKSMLTSFYSSFRNPAIYLFLLFWMSVYYQLFYIILMTHNMNNINLTESEQK